MHYKTTSINTSTKFVLVSTTLLEMDLRTTSWFEIISKSLRTSLVLVQENAIMLHYSVKGF
jgi:hypothetical protein